MTDKPVNITLAGDLSKPAVTLIEKISDAVGGLARPFQIVRVAKAEARATVIHANAEIEVKGLQRRSMRRFIAEEAKKQVNMEQIIRDAIPLLEEKSTPQNVADDWITNFFEKGRIISDEDMQRLWSNILAGEANAPGTYSRKTVNLLSDLDKSDAVLFSEFCNFAWTIYEPTPALVPLILNIKGEIFNRRGINFDSLAHLNSLGLIQFDSIIGFARMDLGSSVRAEYFGKSVSQAIPPPPNNYLAVGAALFTRSGTELARACTSASVEGFFEYVCGHWKRASNLANVPGPVPVQNPHPTP